MGIFSLAHQLGAWLTARLDIRNEKGATAVEYGLMVALIAAVIVTIVYFLGQNVNEAFVKTCDGINKATAKGCS